MTRCGVTRWHFLVEQVEQCGRLLGCPHALRAGKLRICVPVRWLVRPVSRPVPKVAGVPITHIPTLQTYRNKPSFREQGPPLQYQIASVRQAPCLPSTQASSVYRFYFLWCSTPRRPRSRCPDNANAEYQNRSPLISLSQPKPEFV